MSPEQAEGLDVDGRSDVFSLGVVIFELVVGHVPFEGDTASQVIASILRDEPPAVAAQRDDVPRGLDRVIAKALRKDPGDRYQSSGEMAAELRTISRRMLSASHWPRLYRHIVPAAIWWRRRRQAALLVA